MRAPGRHLFLYLGAALAPPAAPKRFHNLVDNLQIQGIKYTASFKKALAEAYRCQKRMTASRPSVCGATTRDRFAEANNRGDAQDVRLELKATQSSSDDRFSNTPEPLRRGALLFRSFPAAHCDGSGSELYTMHQAIDAMWDVTVRPQLFELVPAKL